MAETKNVPLNLDLSPESKTVLAQLTAIENKVIKSSIKVSVPSEAKMQKFFQAISDLQAKQSVNLKINLDADEALKKLQQIKADFKDLGKTITIKIDDGSNKGVGSSSSGGSVGRGIGGKRSSNEYVTLLTQAARDEIGLLKAATAGEVAARKANLKDRMQAEKDYIKALEAAAAAEVAAYKDKQKIAAQQKAATTIAQGKAQAFGASFDGTLAKVQAKQDVQNRRVNRALTEFNETYSGSDLLAQVFGGPQAAGKERLRVAENIANRRNLNPTATAAFLEQARGQQLPAVFDLRRLANADILKQIGFASIYGGAPSALLGGLLGATPLGGAGVALGSNIAQTAQLALAAPKQLFDEVAAKFKETALSMDRSVVGLSASMLQATNVFDAFGRQVTSTPAQLASAQRDARTLQQTVRPVLSSLGLSGSAESNVVQSLQTGLLQRGIFLDPKEFATLSSRLVGTAVAKNPNFFENETIAARDILDLAVGASTAQRTQLANLIGRDTVAKIGKASTGAQLLEATKGLDPFVFAATQSDNPAVLQRQVEAKIGNLEAAGGEKFLEAQKGAIKEFLNAISDEKTIQAAKAVGKAMGEITAGFIKFQAAAIRIGAPIAEFISKNKGLIENLALLTTAVVSVNAALKISAALEASRAAALLAGNRAAGVAGAAEVGKWAVGNSLGRQAAGNAGLFQKFLASGAGGRVVGGLSAGAGAAGAFLTNPLTIAGTAAFLITSAIKNYAEEEQANKLEEFDDKKADIVNRLQTAGGRRPTNELRLKNELTKLGLEDRSNSFDTERAQSNPLNRLRGVAEIINSLGGTPELAKKRAFLEDQRIDAERQRFDLFSQGIDQNTASGQLQANKFLQASLRTRTGFAANKLAADEAALRKAEAEIANGTRLNTAGRIAQLEESLNSGKLAEALNEAKKKLGAAGSDKEKQELARGEFFIAKQDIVSVQSELETLRALQAKGIEPDQAGVERSNVAQSRLQLLAEQQREKDARRAEFGLEERRTAELRQGNDLSTVAGRLADIDLLQSGLRRQRGAIVIETDEDRARDSSLVRQQFANELDIERSKLGVFGLQRDAGLIDRGTIGGRISGNLQDIKIAQNEKTAIGARLTALQGDTSPEAVQEIEKLTTGQKQQDLVIGSKTREVNAERLSAAQSLQGLKVSADALIEAERRSKAELDNLTISYKEQKNALADFKTGLQEAYAGQEEKLFGAAKSYVNAGGDLSKLPGFLQQAVTNPEQYEQSFALARLRGVLRESTGIDDPTLQGASLGIPTFGSRFSENLNNQQRRLENQLDISANDRDLFKTNLQNQRTDFGFKLGQAQQSGLFDSSNIFSSPVGGNNSQVDSFLKNFQQILAQLNQASGITVGSSLPQGGPGGLGTTAGKKFEEQNKAGGTSDPNSKTTPVAVIDDSSINKLAATFAATVSNVLMSGTSSIG